MSEQRGVGEGSQRSVIIIGHGPSIYTGRGAVIDMMTVVRLRQGLLPSHDPNHWGTRTDYLCANSPIYDHGFFPFWLLERNGSPKLTTGALAVLEAKRRLNPKEIFVIGFDRVMHPDRAEVEDPPYTWLAHDKWAEHQLMKELGVRELE